jgi:short-subunit dehydrogenase
MKNALITGATKGIGRAISLAFAKQGLNLSICSRNLKELEDFKIELLKANPDISVFIQVADCSIKQEVRDFARNTRDQLGFVSVIVNNVGMYVHSSILDDEDDTFYKQLNTNLMPAYELYRYFGKSMMEAKDGHIFNICSAASLTPIVHAGTYSVTKVALLGLSNIMKLEMQEYGIKVTSIIPGSTLTSSWGDTPVDKDRFVLPGDIASAIINIYNMSAGANVDEIVIKPVLGQL